jgi:hypothetical protein
MKPIQFSSALFVVIVTPLVAKADARADWSLSVGYGSQEYSSKDFAMLSPWRDQSAWMAPADKDKNEVSRRDFTNALASQIPILGFVRDWRDTLRGQGSQARRQFKFAALGDDLIFSVGSQALPAFSLSGIGGNTVGAGLTWGRISFGSTAMRRTFDRLAATYDRAAEGKSSTQSDDTSSLNWLSMRALENKKGTVDLVMIRASRDLTPWNKDDENIEGTSLGARADLKMWADWKMRGEWMKNRREQGDAANAWKLDMNGSVDLFGKTQIALYIDERDPGYAQLNDMRVSEGYRNQRISMVRNVSLGDVSAVLRLTQTDNENLSLNMHSGQEMSNLPPRQPPICVGSCHLRFLLLPNIRAVIAISS